MSQDKQLNDLRYRVHVHEDGCVILVAAMGSLHHAKIVAKASVDDALPRNMAYVLDTLANRNVGYAFLAGDGGAEWKDLNKDK
jgi:hypothetical protein